MAAVARLRRRRPVDQRPQYLLHAEIVDSRSEEDGRLPAVQEFLHVERMARASNELDVVPHGAYLVGKQRIEPRVVQAFDQLAVVAYALFAGSESLQPLALQIENAAKALAHPDRPAHGRAVDAEHALDFLQQLDRRTDLAVHLVDERDDRRRAKAAHVQ
jgi:hypothetical protein